MKTLLFAASVALLLSPFAHAQNDPVETKEQRDTRMGWWREAKFGMFIHWGVYSVPAGYHDGKPVNGIGEWIMNRGKIPMAEYQTYAKEFNPVKFDAAAFVKTAKDAGMRYIVITAKHHDGFAMFRTTASPWNIIDASPFKRDPLQELAAACRAQGMRLGFYYSQAQDWNNGGAEAGGKWDPAQEHSMDDYIDHVAVPQVRELLTNYGKDIPAVLWWDTPIDMNKERADKLHQVVETLRPDLITNNRLGGGYQGDTETPEQHIPAQGYPGRDWETCMTMNNTWGFKRDDNNWKSAETLIRNLCDIASKGGNYLLNVGPTAEGLIPTPSLERLAQVGAWMKVNGEAIYGSGPTPFGAEAGKLSDTEKDAKGQPKFIQAWEWRCTTKPGKMYVEIFHWPTDAFHLSGVKDKVTKAYLLADPTRQALEVKQDDTEVSVSLPDKAPDAIASVLCLETGNNVPATAK